MPALWRENVLTGHWALDVPHRRMRPQGSLASCPFCPGQEAQTPPAHERIPADGPWRARAFRNAFPILEHHEVLVDAPRHVEAFHELTEAEAVEAVRLWSRRMRAAREGGLSPLLYRNDGARAGASVAHVHAHVVAAREPFPRLAQEAARFSKGCPFEGPGFAARERSVERWRVLEPLVARFAGERWILPVEHEAQFERTPTDRIAALARLLREETRALASAGLDEYNVILHTGPSTAKDFHWHVEILPRRDGIGGFELGAGVFANPGP